MSYVLIGLLFVFLLSCQWSDAAVQRAPPRYPAYQPSTEYVYDYTSRSQLQRNLSVNVEAELSVRLLYEEEEGEDGGSELSLSFSSLSVTWTTPQGSFRDEKTFGDVSKWFSVALTEQGLISEVFYPPDETMATVALKKSISSLFSLDEGEMRTDGTRLVVTTTKTDSSQIHAKLTNKVMTFDDTGLLLQVESEERLVGSLEEGEGEEEGSSSQPLLSFPAAAYSTLSLEGRLEEEAEVVGGGEGRVKPAPELLTADSVEVTKFTSPVPLNDLRPLLGPALSCVGGDTGCMRSLVRSLAALSDDDLELWVTGSFQSALLTPVDRLSLVDALAHLSSPPVTQLLTQHILRAGSHDPDSSELMERALFHFATSLNADRSAVDAMFELVFSDYNSSHLSHKALLSLGGVAGRLRGNSPGGDAHLATEITTTLHSLLDQYTGVADGGRGLKRSLSAPTMQDPALHAVLLDCLGNAGDPSSLRTLVDHMTGDVAMVTGSGELSVRHAAVKAVARQKTVESAEALLRAAETLTLPPSVREDAARSYLRHPLRPRPLSPDSTHHRSRRQLDNDDDGAGGVVSNVTMPTVSWSERFGERNISVELERTIRNSFDVTTAPLSSQYSFSLHDEAEYAAVLLLSGGEERHQMLASQLCLQGIARYNIDILTAFAQGSTVEQYGRHTANAPSLQQGFATAYSDLVASEIPFDDARSTVAQRLSEVPGRFAGVAAILEGFNEGVGGLEGEFELKREAEEVFGALNATFVETSSLALDSMQAIQDALQVVSPGPLLSSLMVDGLPFISSSFFVPFLPFAPQQALANISIVYQRTETVFSELVSAQSLLLSLASSVGPNHRWISPAGGLNSVEGGIEALRRELDTAIENADKSPTQSDDGATLSELQALRAIVNSYLQPALVALETVGDDLIASSRQLGEVFQRTNDAYEALDLAYDRARFEVDATFGQRFHPQFPRRLQSCDLSGGGCGSFPSTAGGRYRSGIDLNLDPNSQVVVPLSGYLQRLDPSSLPSPLPSPLPTLPTYNSTASVILTPFESSFEGVTFLITNLNPESLSFIDGEFYRAGLPLGSPETENESGAASAFIHLEAYKVVGGVEYVIDPTQFLQPILDPGVSVEFECNDVVSYVGGVVVDRQPVTTGDVVSELIGQPLVDGIPGHEFPQPRELVVRGAGTLTPSGGQVQFFSASTFLMVGPLPVQFDFSSVGSYRLSFSLELSLLSKSLHSSLTSHLHSRAEGQVTVGGTVFAEVALAGSLVETVLPLTLRQDFSDWPLVASADMDIILVPSVLNLTSQLVSLTGTGSFAEREVLQSDILWEYSIPPLNQDEFYYAGSLSDETPPVFTPLAYGLDQSDCFVRQLPGRRYSNPAFELEFKVSDPQSDVTLSANIGSYENGDNIISQIELGGNRIIVPSLLPTSEEIFFTVSAINSNGLQTLASCQFLDSLYYDISPPLARINPIRPVSSHPSKMAALLVVFDELPLVRVEVAVGSVPGEGGEGGEDVMGWREVDVTEFVTPPTSGSVEDAYSFGRSGRLIGSILATHPGIDDITTCRALCHAHPDCQSFDHAQEEATCILHDGIEGPPTDPSARFENTFYSPPLATSSGYYHFERLGIGNSTLLDFSNLTFEHDRAYFINVRLLNSLGYESTVSSSQFLVDFYPPVPGRIRNAQSDVTVVAGCGIGAVRPDCIEDGGIANHRVIVDGQGSAAVFNGPSPLLDAMYTSASNFIAANWIAFTDRQSGIFAYTWCLGTSLGSCDLLAPVDPHAELGLASPQSWTNTGLATFRNLSDGSYYLSVQAVSNVEYGGPLATTVQHSTPYVLDTSLPVLGAIEGLEYNATSDLLSFSYNASDPESGISAVSLALGRSQRDTALLPWTDISPPGGAPSASGGGVRLTVVIPDGIPAWVKLRVTNNAGLQASGVAESPITIDRSPPLPGRVRDGGRGGGGGSSEQGSDVDFQTSVDTLCVNWDGFSDPQSGLGEILWSIGRTEGGSSVATAMELSPSEVISRVACLSGLSLSHNATYHSTLLVFNTAMNQMSTAVSSDGVRVDTSPPLTGYVRDGTDREIEVQFSSSQATVAANWGDFRDYESSISLYVVSVYRTRFAGAASELIFTEQISGAVNEFSRNHFALSNGDRIAVEIEAVNGAGNSVTMTSNGYVIDLSPPLVSNIVDGLDVASDLEFQNETTSLTASWSAVYDLESGIVRIEGAIFQLIGGRKSLVYPDPISSGAETVLIPFNQNFWEVDGFLPLEPGSRYVAVVTFTNGAGLQARYETNGVLVDATPPFVESVSISSSDGFADYTDTGEQILTAVTDLDRIELRWFAFDFESGISEYLVGVVDENSTFVTPGFAVFDGETTGGFLENLSLPPGEETYSILLIAVNRAGMESEPAYSVPFRVAVGNSAGVVLDGGDPAVGDIDYTDEIATVTTHFYGFNIQSCGGISRYEWAVGDGPSYDSLATVLPFTESGIVMETNGSGYAQLPLGGLKSYEGDMLFITVRAFSDCGQFVQSTSDGFIIDTSPPSLRVVATGDQALQRAQSEGGTPGEIEHNDFQTSASFSSTWQSNSEDVQVRIGSYPLGNDIQSDRAVSENYIRGFITVPEGIPTYVTVTTRSQAGVVAVASGNPVVLDTTLPLSGEIICDAVGSPDPILAWESDRAYTGIITCSWSDVHDPESGIAVYAVAIGTSPTDQSVLSKTTIPTKAPYLESFVSPRLTFDPAESYYVALYVTNGAGLEAVLISDTVYFDITTPIIENPLLVLPNFGYADYVMGNLTNSSVGAESAVCYLDTDVFTVVFPAAEDAGSAVVSYQLGAGYSPGNDDLLPFTTLTPLPLTPSLLSHTLHPISFSSANRRAIFFSIKASNAHGISNYIASNAVYIVSSTTEQASWISDGPNQNLDIDYQTSTNVSSGYFSVGTNCPLRSYRWAVESVDGMIVQPFVYVEPALTPFETVDNTFFVTTDQVSLYNDETYRLVVQATDYTGAVYRLRSNGSTVTTDGLEPGLVRDGPIPGQDLNYQESVTNLWAQWEGFGDGSPEQEVAYYQVAVGSDREFPNTRTDVVAFTNVGLNRSFAFTGLDLVALDVVYFLTVRARAVSGAFVDATSNGITVGFGHMIIPGDIILERFQSDTTTLTAYWTDFESDLPIRSYEWGIGTTYFTTDELDEICEDTNSNYEDYFDISGLTAPNLDTFALATNLSLQHNTSYFITIRATDQADKCLTIQANHPLLVDLTPPQTTPLSILVGPIESRQFVPEGQSYVTYVPQGQPLNVTWDRFSDPESGVASYSVGIYEQVVCGENSVLIGTVAPTAEIGEVFDSDGGSEELLREVFSGMDLLPRVSYVVVVTATNNAGLTGRGFSEPILIDSAGTFPGTVKDGSVWESDDVVFQYNLSMLSAVFTHAIAPPPYPGVSEDGPCPNTTFLDLSDPDLSSSLDQVPLFGALATGITYLASQVSASVSPLGLRLSAERDTSSERIVSGAYRVSAELGRGGIVEMDILAASGMESFVEQAVTSVVFIESSNQESIFLAKFEPDFPDFDFPSAPEFSAVGLQIYRTLTNSSAPRGEVLLWAKFSDPLSSTIFARHELAVDLSQVHKYTFYFNFEQIGRTYTRSVDLFVDSQQVASLNGIPQLSDRTKMVLHLFNNRGFVPENTISNTPTVESVFGNVTLPLRVGHVCDFGFPFHSRESPVIEFRAGVGTLPGSTNIVPFETVGLLPCQACLPGVCESYSCNSTDCPSLTDTISFSFPNLTLSPGYHTGSNQSEASNFEFEFESDLTDENSEALLSAHFQPAVYFVTVEAITASGRRFQGNSNGITIDTTSPVMTAPIEHFDVSFSLVEPTRYQGSDSVISARWRFLDLQSGVVEYLWAIGSTPFGTDVQNFTSTGLNPEGTNSNLLGVLEHNVTYHVTVLAVNGAGLTSNVTSSGVTYLDIQLNVTRLEGVVRVEFDDVFRFPAENGSDQEVLRVERENRAAITWAGVGEEIEDVFWYISSEPQSAQGDVLPRTQVSFAGSQSAAVDNGVIFLNGAPFANVSESIALAEAKGEDPADNELFFEPGRLLFNSLELCNFVHRCTIVRTSPTVVIRAKDREAFNDRGDVNLVISQRPDDNVNPARLPVLDREYSVSFTSPGSLEPSSRFFAGFLNQSDITRRYRVDTPYISNPFETMTQTSREIARRFMEIGGPAFYTSFIGQDSLLVPLEITASFDPTLDWSVASPELAYWDVDEEVWREVGATCMNNSRAEFNTYTITVQVCSTVLSQGNSDLRPSSLRRRRQASNDVIFGSGSAASGVGGEGDDVTTITTLSFLDRPVEFVVIRIGNFSTNTPPVIQIPPTPLPIIEDGGLFEFQLEFLDAEGDTVQFSLTSVPRLGDVTLTSSGLLSYTPCQNCIGFDAIEVTIVEDPFGINNTPLSTDGRILFEISNQNDRPEVYFYANPFRESGDTVVISNETFLTFVEGNRTSPEVAARIVAFDLDGYSDDLEVFIQDDGAFGTASVEIWLDVVTVSESFPATWPEGFFVDSYNDYVAFIGATIRYLPDDDVDFTGTDTVSIVVSDASGLQNAMALTLEIQVLPSLCLNNGLCGGSEMDPMCRDIEARRSEPSSYNCSCVTGFGGQFCEIELEPPAPLPVRVCPDGVPLVVCDGDVCGGAVCPSHPQAECRPSCCGGCRAEWYEQGEAVTCRADSPGVCDDPLPGTTTDCDLVSCDCPAHPFECPEDSILVVVRTNECCVSYECACPPSSCPLLMECGLGVQPVPDYRGNGFPGRCCPLYNFDDINECGDDTLNRCSDICVNKDNTYACTCSEGTTLAQDQVNCGVCPYNGMEYLHGDRVKIGCNWCVCRGDALSGERWHCTAASCDPGCTSNGLLYPVRGVVSLGDLTCECVPTDSAAVWECLV